LAFSADVLIGVPDLPFTRIEGFGRVAEAGDYVDVWALLVQSGKHPLGDFPVAALYE